MNGRGLADSRTRVVEKENQRVVPSTDRSAAIRMTQELLDVRGIEIPRRCRRMPLGRQRDDARQTPGVLGVAPQEMHEKAPQRGQPAITGRDAVVPTFFHVV